MAGSNGSKHATMAVASMCIMFIVWTGVCWDTVSLYAAPIVKDWGIQSAQYMLAVTLISLCNALVSLLAYGTLVERFGTRKLMLVGGILATASFAVFALAQNTIMLYVAAVLFGVGISPLNINTANVVVGKWFKKRTQTFVGIIQTCGSVSGIVFATVFAALISNLGWRMPFWITCAASAVATVLCFAFYKGDPEDLGEKPMYADDASVATAAPDAGASTKTAADGISFKSMLGKPRFYLLVIGYLLVGIVAYSVLGNFAYMADDLGFGDLSGTMLSVALLASAIAMTLIGIIADKVGSRWTVVLCFVCFIAAAVILYMGQVSLPLMYIAAALIGIAYDAGLMPVGASVREAFGENEYGKKLGLIAGFDYVGISLGVTIFATLHDAFHSYAMGLIVFIVLAVIATALVFIGTKRTKD